MSSYLRGVIKYWLCSKNFSPRKCQLHIYKKKNSLGFVLILCIFRLFVSKSEYLVGQSQIPGLQNDASLRYKK